MRFGHQSDLVCRDPIIGIDGELGGMGLVCVGSAGFAATLAAKQKNRGKVEAMSKDGRLTVLLKSDVKEIRPNSVVISLGDEIIEIPNDAVIVSAGGILPTTFLQKIGIKVETKWGSE